MENKYQKAYEKLADTLHWGELPKDLELCDEMKVIKELIDNYSKLSQFDRAVFFNANGVCVNGITYEQLEKALDKACEELANADKLLHQYTKGEYIGKEQWKEYLLKESERQNEV